MPYCPHCKNEVSSRDLLADDNSFRDDPPDDQVRLDDLGGGGGSSEPSDDSLWNDVEITSDDVDQLDVVDPDLQPGEGWNENDPEEW